MNPRGFIARIHQSNCDAQDLRHTLGENFIRYIKAYQPKPMTAIKGVPLMQSDLIRQNRRLFSQTLHGLQFACDETDCLIICRTDP